MPGSGPVKLEDAGQEPHFRAPPPPLFSSEPGLLEVKGTARTRGREIQPERLESQ